MIAPPESIGGSKWKVVDPTLVANWDDSLSSDSEQQFFLSSSWAAVLKNTYGHKPIYLTLNNGEQVSSVWPIMEVSSVLTGRRGISLPFTDECEPIIGSHSSTNDLFASVLETAATRSWRYFELRGGGAAVKGATPSVSFYTHVLKLKPDPEAMLSNCEGGVRRAIRKASASGLRTEISHSRAAVKSFFDLHCGTRRKHGLPPQPMSFFENIYKKVLSQGKGFVASVTHNNQVIAAGMFFHMRGRAIYKFGASDERLQHLRGNNLMMWAAICECLRLNCKSLHLGRTSRTNEGLRRYKLGWGAEENLLNYFRFDLKRREFVTTQDRASGWHNKVFQRLPTCALRAIGSALYRHIA